MKTKIDVQETTVTVFSVNEEDYISLTDIARHKSNDPFIVVCNWMRNRNTIEYLGLWETLYNPDFKPIEFDRFRMEAGLNAFTLSPQKWIKELEQARIGWSAKRELSRINYHIHTDAIKNNLVPNEITPAQTSRIYASEADVLNVAMFGMTASEWRDANPALKGNIRDYASINELICLSNLESLNSVLIQEGLPQSERLIRLNSIAIHQMQVLDSVSSRKLLK